MLEGYCCLSHTESRSQVQRWQIEHSVFSVQVELLQATATARACSLFRRHRAQANRQHSHAGTASGEASPGLRFAHIVEVDISP